MKVAGACLCGACRFTAEAAEESGVCHCTMCQKWTGGMFLGVEVTEGPTFEAGAPVGEYASSDWAKRVFCRDCGSSLAWVLDGGGHAAVSAAAIEGGTDLPVTSEIFIDEKPATYALAGDRKCLTGAEVFAMFQEGGA